MYRIYSEFRYLSKVGLARIYYINGLPFTFDEIEESTQDMVEYAMSQEYLSIEDLLRSSSYLISEQCHPIIFELEEITCDEELPF